MNEKGQPQRPIREDIMKRSEVNTAIRQAEAILATHQWALPNWARWNLDDHKANPVQSAWLAERQLGWDVTDFNQGRFSERGLTLFCVRNGKQGDPSERPYAEKLLFVGVDQETPFHAHKVKLEDIIVRGAGTLCVEFTSDGFVGSDDMPEQVYIDGAVRPLLGAVHRLSAGQSITIPRGVQHRFWGEDQPVFVAEVSQCNDDNGDNYFLDEIGRFSDIEEDEAPHRILWNEA